MIDLHIHILPGIDDGSPDLEESVEMAQIAADCGTRVIVATPHCNMTHMYENTYSADYRRRFSYLKQALAEAEPSVQLLEGMEIFCVGDVAGKLRSGELICLNHTRYPLVEFDFEAEEFEITDQLERLLNAGYTPVLAHPERYRCVSRNLGAVYQWYQMGVVIQINKGSVPGGFGRRVQRTVDAILRHRLAAVAASDAHSCEIRTPDLSRLQEVLDWEYGDGCSWLLLEENPSRILQDREVLWDNPIPF